MEDHVLCIINITFVEGNVSLIILFVVRQLYILYGYK